MWNDESISTSILSAIVCYFAIGIVALLSILVVMFLGYPAAPLIGEWPTHGWYFLIVDCAMLPIVIGLVKMNSEIFMKAAFCFVLAAFALEVYAFSANICWLAYFMLNTLSPAARAHQTLLNTTPLLVVLLALVVFHYMALVSLWQVIQLLPDLKVFYNLGTIDPYGDYSEHADDEDEGE